MTGILHRDSGSVRILGLDPARQRVALSYRIGSVFGAKSQLWFHLPASDTFRLLGAVYNIPKKDLETRTTYLRELFQISDFFEAPVRKLSLGQRIRCEIAASFLHRPSVVFLDEPTIGLDVVAKQQIRELLRVANEEEKVTVFLTSHDIGDIEKICKRAVIIHHGTLVLDQSVKSLRYNSLNKKILSLRFTKPVEIDIPGATVLKTSSGSDSPEGFGVKIEADTTVEPIQNLIARLAVLGPITDLTVEDEPLENIIAEIFNSRNREEAGGRGGKYGQ
jgi:ABC-2 type transport system ATP-binding protein